ncbi:MAG: LPS assembly protein LptD [Planctomycetes bacterium]|nr:LPS assembly protein LptD [Planctomycetota bacterium]
MRTTFVFAAALVVFMVQPCHAEDPFQILYLESGKPVQSWQKDGVRTFVAPDGATLRQGGERLVAPCMVAWFEETGAGRGRLRVYAEQLGGGRQVTFLEGKDVRTCGAALLEFEAAFSFVLDCPLHKSEGAQSSPLLSRAESVTAGLEAPHFWEKPPEGPAPELFERVMARFSADQVQIFGNEGTAVYIGDVRCDYGNISIRADRAVLWYNRARKSYEVYAEGAVRIRPKGGAAANQLEGMEDAAAVLELLGFASADRLYINPQAAKGLAENIELRIADPDPQKELVYVVRGNDAYIMDANTLEVRQMSLTTCQFARPHYRIAAARAQVIRQPPSTFLDIWDVKLQVGRGETTLLRLPFMGTDLTNRSYLVTDYALGSSSKFGTFMQTTWRPLDIVGAPPWIKDWTANLDYYSARGPGIGSELTYESTGPGYPHHEGMARFYYVQDSKDEDDTGLPVPKSNRGRLHVRHRVQLDPNWRIDGELYWLSDEGFLNEYFNADFEDEKTPETYLLARYLHDSTYASLLVKRRLNSFLTQVQSAPSADVEMMALPLGRFVYDGSLSAGRYDLEFSDLLTPSPPDPPQMTRFHTQQRLSLPFSWGILRLDPSVRVLATRTDSGAYNGASFAGSKSRTGVGAGLSASTTFSRTFPTQSKLLGLNRLRHVVIPYVQFETLSVSGAASSEFVQMDQVDQIDSGSVTTIGLKQRFQTKRWRDEQWRSIDWMELDLAYVKRSSDSVNMLLDEDYISADMEMRLTDHVSLHSRDNRFGLENLRDVWNFGMSLDWAPGLKADLDYDRIEGVSSTFTTGLYYPLSDRYALLLDERYEFDSAGTGNSKSLESELVIRRLLDQWVLDVGFHHKKAGGESAVIFGFGPKGWGIFRDLRRAAR